MRPELLTKTQAKLLLSLAAAWGALTADAVAQPQKTIYCSGVVSFGEESPAIRLMQVATKKQRLPFYKDRTEQTRHCPAEVDSCQQKAFVVPGDLLLVGPGTAGFGCASYISPDVRRIKDQFRETSGFVPLSELAEVKVGVSGAADWRGVWYRSAEAQIRIEAEGGKLKIMGEATFGALDPDRVRRGAVNMGELEGLVSPPKSNMIAIGEGYDGSKPFGDDRSECRAKLRLLPPYLVVEDNGGCGGMNVSFTGLYMRVKDQARR